MKRDKKEYPKKDFKYQASVSELVQLGQTIADSAVKVPLSVLNIAKRAITLRREVTGYFLGKKEFAFHSNRSHKHFVDRLEEICEVLERNSFDDTATEAEDVKKDDKSKEKGVDADMQAWLNRFAALTVEDTPDIPEDESDKLDIIKAEVVEEESQTVMTKDAFGENQTDYTSEHFFRIFCMLRDLQNWKMFLAQTWEEYRDDKIDLMSASVVTDSALQLSKDLVEETLISLPAHIRGEGLELQNQLYCAACETRGVQPSPSSFFGEAVPGGGKALPFNSEMGEFVEWTYFDISILLQSLVPQLGNNTIPVYRSGFGGYYDPNTDRNKMSVADKFNEDKVIMLELFPEFHKIHSFGIPMPVRDEITAGFVDFIASAKPSLWLCFAIRIMLDTHSTLRHTDGAALRDLKASGTDIVRTINEYWTLSETHPKPKFWDANGNKGIKMVQDIIEHFVDFDIFLQFTKAGSRVTGRARRGDTEHLLFHHNPILSGLLQFKLHASMQTIGQNLVSQWYDVQQLAFLHNLAEKTTTQSLPWPDMDFFIKIHGEARIFVGDRPKDAEQSLNRLELATGISSAARFAKDSRKKEGDFHLPDHNGTKARRLKPTTKAVNIFRMRYMSDWGSEQARARAISGPDVDHLLAELMKTSPALDKSNTDSKKIALARTENRLERKWQKTHNIGGLQLLALIKNQLYEEEPILKFNYFGMHKRAVEILRGIRDKEHEKFVQYFTEGYMPDDSYISNIVLLVLHVARGGARDRTKLGLAIPQAVSRMVLSCCEVMKEYLRENGNIGCKEMRKLCKNQRVLDREIGDGEGNRDEEAEEKFMFWTSLEDVIGTAQMESLKFGIPVAR